MTNIATGVVTHGITTASGVYSINDLQPGTYQVHIVAPSFGGLQQGNVVVSANAVRRVDVKPQPASVQQNVTVTDVAPALQTDRTDVNVEISAQQLENLPTSTTRNFQSLFRTIPGSTPPAIGHSGPSNPQGSLNFNINGTPETQNNTKVDGVSDLFPWLPEDAAYVPPQDSIQAVSIVTNTFDAEQGSGASSQIKRGHSSDGS